MTKKSISRAGFLPTVALTANYMVTNPSLVNGFERKFRGMWAVGAMVQIPIWNWGEGMYKVKAAKAEANIARYQLADAKEKVELQVSQASYKVNEAAKRLSMAEKIWKKQTRICAMPNWDSWKESFLPVTYWKRKPLGYLPSRTK